MAEWVLAVERAYVSAATTKRVTATAGSERDRAKALAAIGAVASHYLAVGSPRSMGLVVDAMTRDDGELSITAHRTWFSPTDIRCAGAAIAGARETTLAEALACDIVCIHVPTAIPTGSIRRGTHLNVLATMALPDEQVEARAVEVATRLAQSAPAALRWTKHTLNHWLRQAAPIFDASLALEFIGFAGPEGKEGIDAFLQKRAPAFNPETPI